LKPYLSSITKPRWYSKGRSIRAATRPGTAKKSKPALWLSDVLKSFSLAFPKGTVLLTINGWHSELGDLLFSALTNLGDAYTALVLLLVVLRYPYKYLLIYLLAFLIHVLFVHIFKQWLADGALRPYAFFYRSGEADLIQLVEGIKIRNLNSFPSGHTTTGLFLASYFAVLLDRGWVRWLLISGGLAVGLSRIYLVQHWFVDVYFGVVFGILSTFLAWIIIERRPRNWHRESINWSRILNLRKQV
jgi:membrane-associated phospholipid phosphatase